MVLFSLCFSHALSFPSRSSVLCCPSPISLCFTFWEIASVMFSDSDVNRSTKHIVALQLKGNLPTAFYTKPNNLWPLLHTHKRESPHAHVWCQKCKHKFTLVQIEGQSFDIWKTWKKTIVKYQVRCLKWFPDASCICFPQCFWVCCSNRLYNTVTGKRFSTHFCMNWSQNLFSLTSTDKHNLLKQITFIHMLFPPSTVVFN